MIAKKSYDGLASAAYSNLSARLPFIRPGLLVLTRPAAARRVFLLPAFVGRSNVGLLRKGLRQGGRKGRICRGGLAELVVPFVGPSLISGRAFC